MTKKYSSKRAKAKKILSQQKISLGQNIQSEIQVLPRKTERNSTSDQDICSPADLV